MMGNQLPQVELFLFLVKVDLQFQSDKINKKNRLYFNHDDHLSSGEKPVCVVHLCPISSDIFDCVN